jgi:(1->4)-alpha-D-glucan 1-alpha-D-glucosylmutase
VANRRFKRKIEERDAPDGNEEYLLYQTLLGTWPINADGAAATSVNPEFVLRIQQYMAKALKEAKLNTSWIQPNAEWDSAMSDFIAGILEPGSRNKFIPQFLPVVEEISRLGMINSLTQTIIKLTAPGVPDIYQGTELWDDSLVDPDNRRPVDYERRRKMLGSLVGATAEELLRCWPDGRIKLWLIQRVLRLRRLNPELFQLGSYEALNVAGNFADCVISFARIHGQKAIVIAAPRLSSRVGFPPLGERWADTAIELSERLPACAFRDVCTNREIKSVDSRISLANAMAELPFAVLVTPAVHEESQAKIG